MREDMNRKKMHKAIDATLSGLNGNPWLFQRISARAEEGEVQVKKKLSVGLVLTIVLLLVAAVALGVTIARELNKSEVVRNVMEEKAVPLTVNNDTGAAVNGMFTAEELAALVQELEASGIRLEESNRIMQALQNGQGYYEEEAIMEICRQAFGGYIGTWTLEQQDWYGHLMEKIGFIESYESHLPGDGNMTYEEAEAFAFRKIRAEYGEDLPLENRDIWKLSRLFYAENPEDPNSDAWEFMLEPRDLDHGMYGIHFRDSDPEGTAEVRGSRTDWTKPYSGEELLGAFWGVYGRECDWTQETWQKLHDMAQEAVLMPGEWYEQTLKAYRMTAYPAAGEGDISRDDAIGNAREALNNPRAALNGAVLTEYEGDRQWIVSFIIHIPDDGTQDDEAGLYAVAVGSGSGEIRSIRKLDSYGSESFAYVPEDVYEKSWEGMLRGDDVLAMAVTAATEKYPDMDLTNEEKYEISAESFDSWYVLFKPKDIHLGQVTAVISGDGEILSIEAEASEPDGDHLFDRFWRVYGYFGEWDQSVWVRLGSEMAGLDPAELDGRILKATRYPEESSVRISHEEAKELGILATGKRVAEVNTCVLVDAEPHPVWIMRILTDDALNPLIGIDAETGDVAFREQFRMDYTPHYTLYSMPETWRKAELETLGAVCMAKAAIACRFPDAGLDEPEIDADAPAKWDILQEGLTVRFTARQEGLKSYEVELDENGFVLRCEETD